MQARALQAAEHPRLYWGNWGCFGADLLGQGHAQPASLENPQTMALFFQGSIHGNCSCLLKTEVPALVFLSLLLGARAGCQTMHHPALLCLSPFLETACETLP